MISKDVSSLSNKISLSKVDNQKTVKISFFTYEAYVHYGYTLKEIAEYLGIHYVTISRTIKRVEVK